MREKDIHAYMIEAIAFFAALSVLFVVGIFVF